MSSHRAGANGGSRSGPPPDNVITHRPLRLRWGDWRIPHVIQVHVQPAAAYEEQRAQDWQAGRPLGSQMPPHFVLDDGIAETALALMRHRESEEALLEIGYLAALMEALLNTPCPILRTDLIRRVYQEVKRLSSKLGLRWGGRGRRFMLPLNQDAQDPHWFRHALAPLGNLQEFFATLREIAHQRYRQLAREYVLYYPRRWNL